MYLLLAFYIIPLEFHYKSNDKWLDNYVALHK